MRKYVAAGAVLLFCASCTSLIDKLRPANLDGQVEENMHACQLAAESYAKDHGGKYPAAIDNEFKAYFPGGSGKEKLIGRPPTNPYTSQPEWPKLGQIIDLSFERKRMLSHVAPGNVEYTCLKDGYAYAIIGGGVDGNAIPRTPSEKKELILTNVREEKSK